MTNSPLATDGQDEATGIALGPGGKIYLTLNPLPTGEYLTAELRDFFARRGADIERERVFFKRGLRG